MKKIASIIDIRGEQEFMLWLESLPYHVTEKRKKNIYEVAKNYKRVLWIAGSISKQINEEKKVEFYFYND